MEWVWHHRRLSSLVGQNWSPPWEFVVPILKSAKELCHAPQLYEWYPICLPVEQAFWPRIEMSPSPHCHSENDWFLQSCLDRKYLAAPISANDWFSAARVKDTVSWRTGQELFLFSNCGGFHLRDQGRSSFIASRLARSLSNTEGHTPTAAMTCSTRAPPEALLWPFVLKRRMLPFLDPWLVGSCIHGPSGPFDGTDCSATCTSALGSPLGRSVWAPWPGWISGLVGVCWVPVSFLSSSQLKLLQHQPLRSIRCRRQWIDHGQLEIVRSHKYPDQLRHHHQRLHHPVDGVRR